MEYWCLGDTWDAAYDVCLRFGFCSWLYYFAVFGGFSSEGIPGWEMVWIKLLGSLPGFTIDSQSLWNRTCCCTRQVRTTIRPSNTTRSGPLLTVRRECVMFI